MPADRQLRRLLSLYALVAAAMLLVAIGQHEYSYYVLLRWVVCFAAAVATALGLRWRQLWAAGIFPFVALLFNPFVPVELSRDSWGVIDAGASILFLAVVPFLGFPNVTGRIGAKLWQRKLMLVGGLAAVAVVALLYLTVNFNESDLDRKIRLWREEHATPVVPTQPGDIEAMRKYQDALREAQEYLDSLRQLTPTPEPTPTATPAPNRQPSNAPNKSGDIEAVRKYQDALREAQEYLDSLRQLTPTPEPAGTR